MRPQLAQGRQALIHRTQRHRIAARHQTHRARRAPATLHSALPDSSSRPAQTPTRHPNGFGRRAALFPGLPLFQELRTRASYRHHNAKPKSCSRSIERRIPARRIPRPALRRSLPNEETQDLPPGSARIRARPQSRAAQSRSPFDPPDKGCPTLGAPRREERPNLPPRAMKTTLPIPAPIAGAACSCATKISAATATTGRKIDAMPLQICSIRCSAPAPAP